MIGVKPSLLPTFCDLGDEVSGRVGAWECLANPVYIFVPRVGATSSPVEQIVVTTRTLALARGGAAFS